MAATLVDALPTGHEWLYEAKFDGYRALALKDGANVKILSRKGNDLTSAYPAIRLAVGALKATSAAIRYFAFDLLHLNGADLVAEPLAARRAALQMALAGSDIDFSEELTGSPEAVIGAIAHVGLEGVVAKRRDSRYEPGKRSGAWQKFKIQLRQEFVVGGYKPDHRSFQSLVVGYNDKKKLRFAARVRAGFSAAQRAALIEKLRPLQAETCPFADLPSEKSGHWGEGVTKEDMTTLKWVQPRLVAEIAFTEWTRDGNLRHSAFVGLRPDKDGRSVVRERAEKP
jgi:bifunctional non-homologous end joining protein LigD